MKKQALDAAKSVDALLNRRQEAKFRQLRGIERLLFVRLVNELKGQLSEQNGRITSQKGSVALSKAIDAVFVAVTKQRLGDFAQGMADDMGTMLDMNARYYKALVKPKKDPFDQITKSVDAKMRKRMGIGSKGDVQLGGFLSEAFQTQTARNEVNQLVSKAVAGGIPMRQLENQLRVRIKGTREAAGVLEKNLTGFVLDAYQIADSATNVEFADKLGLKFFIYSGGLIETSREFCRKRNNKVFTIEEATNTSNGWATDPTLPRTKEERESGVLTGYQPLEDRGRWRCRHRLLFIPYEEAVRRRPDLAKAGDEPKTVNRPEPLKKAPKEDLSLRIGEGLPEPPKSTDQTGGGPRQVPGTLANELRDLKRTNRKSSDYPLADAEGSDSLKQHTLPNGALTAARAELHRQIIADVLSGVPSSKNPTLYMMGGGSAAGKSTIANAGLLGHPESHVLLNSDDIKEDLPEYRDGMKAGDRAITPFVHEESSVINNEAMVQSRANKQDTVWDGTGDGNYDTLKARLLAYRKQGFRIIADYATVPTEMAVERAQKRARGVPIVAVRSIHAAVSRVLPRAVADGLFDQVTLWDTSTRDLIKVMSARGKVMIIHNQRLWESFLAKGAEVQ
jgi:predicted ABC-type ATPase